MRGYEGYVAPDYYCSYKRFPNRECTTGANGSARGTSGPSPDGAAPQIRASERNVLEVAAAWSGRP